MTQAPTDKAPATPRRSALTLGLAVAIAGALLALVHTLTAPAIETSRATLLRRAIVEVLPPAARYDNDPLNDRLDASASAMASTSAAAPVRITQIYRARLGADPAGAVLALRTERGYSGDIALLVGIDRQDTIQGVRVTAHRETPGLGDAIEAGNSDWIHQFDGLDTRALQAADWQIAQDGGHFDGLSGASITARAVVGAVRDAVYWYQEDRPALFDTPPETPSPATATESPAATEESRP